MSNETMWKQKKFIDHVFIGYQTGKFPRNVPNISYTSCTCDKFMHMKYHKQYNFLEDQRMLTKVYIRLSSTTVYLDYWIRKENAGLCYPFTTFFKKLVNRESLTEVILLLLKKLTKKH